MQPSISRGTIAQGLALLTWLADIGGHSPVGAVLSDPNLASEITMFIGLGFSLWGIAEHVYAAWNVPAPIERPTIPPSSLVK